MLFHLRAIKNVSHAILKQIPVFPGSVCLLWEEALQTAKQAALGIPGARYVGWDLTCTEENRWIIVEGNAMTLYIGQQATLGVGKRKKLLEAIHYEERIRSESALHS